MMRAMSITSYRFAEHGNALADYERRTISLFEKYPKNP
jgi:hypothetical protein